MKNNFILTGFSDEISSDISEQFAGLNALGIKYFEIRGVDGTNIADISEEKARQVKKLADENGIKVSSIGSPIGKINIKDPIEPHLEKLKHIIRLAKIFQTRYIRIFSFFIGEDEKAEDYKDEVMRRMKMMVKIAEEENVILLHENEKGIYGDIAKRCHDIFENVVSDNLKAVFDPANFVQCAQITYPDAWDMLKDHVVYMHIKDADGLMVVPPGKGKGNLKQILQSLKDEGYNGFLSLEPHLAQFDGLKDLEEDNNTSHVNAEKAGLRTFKTAYDALIEIINNLK